MNWTIEHRDSIALLTFSRLPENFMDFGSMIELGDLLEDLAARPDHGKVIMLAGGTDGVFINHADPSDLVKAGEGRATPQEAGSWARALRLLEEIPQPAIAAIDGLASGGGNEITLACTLRLGSERIRLQQPEVGAGIIPGGGGSVRLPRLLGPGIAAEAVITGRAFGAQESLRAGWINAVLPTRGFNDQALLWAAAIAEKPAPALNAAKRSIVFGSRMTFADALALEHQLFSDLSATSKTLKTETAR
jgi:enoyl-CoA hydratase